MNLEGLERLGRGDTVPKYSHLEDGCAPPAHPPSSGPVAQTSLERLLVTEAAGARV